MVSRKITIKESVVESIAEISWFIESEGFPATAEKFSDDVYDFIELLADERRRYKICNEPERALMGFKCLNYKKYTIVFMELNTEIIVCEFLPSKMIYW
ncbi:type II toxin-antitoxin system RelE/ParE family toxin [Pedobacter aquatilis]|uniref:type II toxin-antitoxin system RelE/ParE family toxin n=1 Tax=Pedobacter aquatilis TaxID=351343 RepID=UPI0025B5722B|nr:type II toxin-antitoxin system RelE/ParE family toxin [Pedobacter aquatilis]MDN3587207.1 type II toxin-antitoxin system RelE/ParE family toxin [Pedobacter aquatilis]